MEEVTKKLKPPLGTALLLLLRVADEIKYLSVAKPRKSIQTNKMSYSAALKSRLSWSPAQTVIRRKGG